MKAPIISSLATALFSMDVMAQSCSANGGICRPINPSCCGVLYVKISGTCQLGKCYKKDKVACFRKGGICKGGDPPRGSLSFITVSAYCPGKKVCYKKA